jgi:hypothetical protein
MAKVRANSMHEALDTMLRRRLRGLLSIENLRGSALEIGEVYVENGHILYARTNELGGPSALRVMLDWRDVTVSFVRNDYPTPTLPSWLQATNLIAEKAQSREMPPSQSGSADRASSLADDSRLDGTAPGMEWVVPRRRVEVQDMFSLSLTRAQRCMYMLVDGRRSIADLARCTRKTMREVGQLLSELEERGLIMIEKG